MSLSKSIVLSSGVTASQALCAGAGLCGSCRVRFLDAAPPLVPEEQARISDGELASGWRLACKHVLLASCRIEVFAAVTRMPGPRWSVAGGRKEPRRQSEGGDIHVDKCC